MQHPDALSRPGRVNALTIDVEDYFQVSAFERHIDRQSWSGIPGRVERNTRRIQQLLDEHGIKATFFTLGWVAERHPNLIRDLLADGHEIASHGYEHTRVTQHDRAAFRRDISKTKDILETIGGHEVLGYRAASYSIARSTPWAHQELCEAGYRYSSSVYPIRHDLYGIPDAPRFRYHPIPDRQDFVEIPITTIELAGQRIPCGGGGYFRFFPYRITRWAIGRVNDREHASALFYFHPWEIDPDQPRVPGLPWKTRFRHYLNLGRNEARLRRLLGDFRWGRMDEVFLGTTAAPVAADRETA